MERQIIKIIQFCKGTMDIRDYKLIFLQLLLYKYLSENESDFYMVEYPFNELVDRIKSGIFKLEDLEYAMYSIESSTERTGAYKVFEGIFDLSSVHQNKNSHDSIIRTIIELSEVNIAEIDMNQLLEYIALYEGKMGSENTTPLTVGKLMLKLATTGLSSGTVLDQTCGTATMLSKVNDYINATEIVGQESNVETCRIAKINMIINCLEQRNFNIINENCLFGEELIDKKFDVQISHFPWSMKSMQDPYVLAMDKRYGKYKPTSNMDSYFILNALHHMSEGDSRLVMLTTINPLNDSSSTIKAIREDYVKDNLLDAVIKLPSCCVFGTSIPGYIVIFKKKRKDNSVFIMDASKYFIKERHSKIATITDESIKKALKIYKERKDKEDVCYCVPIDEIIANDFSLATEKYIEKRRVTKLLENETLVYIKDIVDVIKPKNVSKENKVPVLSPKTIKYPIPYDKLEEEFETNIKVQKGDIIFLNGMMMNMYLVDEEPTQDIWIRDRDILFRPKDIQSEYLYLFFKSDIGKQVIDIASPTALGMSRLTLGSMDSIKVPLPKKDAEEYRRVFEIENHLQIDISAYNALLANRDKYIETVTVEDVLNQELAGKVKVCKQQMMQAFLSDDIRELNACFKAKAYKATLILAGSILEAVLIDWLTEIKGEDYFKKDYMITDRNGRSKRADLIDYINEIKEIEKPNWMDEAQKAHEIRKKRNLVHAKLCLNQAVMVNEDTCRMVIEYLKDVLKTRGINT